MLVLHFVFIYCLFFFFNDTATTEIYTLSLHDALPISDRPDLRPHAFLAYERVVFRDRSVGVDAHQLADAAIHLLRLHAARDRKSTRLNSSHSQISYAVFCLKKKNKNKYKDKIHTYALQ